MCQMITLFVAVLLLCGCQSTDGRYVPSCVAYEGDTIELRGGKFVWNRFTDEVRLDESGNKIDAFPDFPKTGTYVKSASRIELSVEGDETQQTYYLLSLDNQTYLLSAAEQGRYAFDGVVERCALRKEVDSQ